MPSEADDERRVSFEQLIQSARRDALSERREGRERTTVRAPEVMTRDELLAVLTHLGHLDPSGRLRDPILARQGAAELRKTVTTGLLKYWFPPEL